MPRRSANRRPGRFGGATLLLLCLTSSCGGGETSAVPVPDGWQIIDLGDVSFAVPPEAADQGGSQVDSTVGVLDGDGYRITYDLGRFGEDLSINEGEDGFVRSRRVIAGGSFPEVGFVPSDEPFGWARVIQVDVSGDRTFTVRVSCQTIDSCGLADDVFDSISLT